MPSPRSRVVSVLVLASATPSDSMTDSEPAPSFAATASRSAARRIAEGISLSYFRGRGPNGLPPPFHWVARVEPCPPPPGTLRPPGPRPCPRPAGALLRPGLAASAGDLAAPAGRVRARPARRELFHHRLVQERDPGRGAEHRVGQIERLRVPLAVGGGHGR